MGRVCERYKQGLRLSMNALGANRTPAPSKSIEDSSKPPGNVVCRINGISLPRSSTNQFVDKATTLIRTVDCTLTGDIIELFVNEIVVMTHELEGIFEHTGNTCFPFTASEVVWKTGILITNISADVGLCNHKWGFHLNVRAEGILRARIGSVTGPPVHVLYEFYSLGKGIDGALGHGNFDDVAAPQPIETFYAHTSGMLQIASIAAASDPSGANAAHSLAVTTTGAHFADIVNLGVFVGLPYGVRYSKQKELSPLRRGGYSVAVTESGSVYTWGKWLNGRLGCFLNSLGMCYIHWLGLGPIPPVPSRKNIASKPVLQQYQLSPMRVASFDGVHVAQVASGPAHAMAITSSGQLYAWGKNSHGQLGLGHCLDQFEPQVIVFPKQSPQSSLERTKDMHLAITASACGDMLSMAVDSTGHVWTWGAGVCGKRLPSTVLERGLRSEFVPWPWLHPQRMLKLPPTIACVAAGSNHFHAYTAVGDVYSWNLVVLIEFPEPKLQQDWDTVEGISCGGGYEMQRNNLPQLDVRASVVIEGLSFLARDLAQLWLQCKSLDSAGCQCDLILIASGQKIFVHQMVSMGNVPLVYVLAARCPHLRDRLVDELQSRNATGLTELILHDLRYDLCLLVLEYLYTDTLLTPLDPASSTPLDLHTTALEFVVAGSSSAPSSFGSDFEAALGSFVWSDLVLVAQGERIHVHKCMLIARSEYFRGLFGSQLREAFLAELSVDVSFATLRRVLVFVYTGVLAEAATDDVLLDDLIAADRLGIPRLKVNMFLSILVDLALCEARLDITFENCMEFLVVADMISAHVLREAAVTFILDNLRVLTEAPSFLQLVQDYPKLMDEIIHHPSRAKERMAWREYEQQMQREAAETTPEWRDEAEFPLLPFVFLIAFALAYAFVAGELPRPESNIPIYNGLMLLGLAGYVVFKFKSA
ncbi:transmembrane protein [Achlya hypogyna]|uniref:Transmembrane protein n=1 Tax=Achlya hypogyna TaxID=1202772 RepID=A0A1V9Y9X6_ACHHY|nr:transmembrane protein [Achlya hypogyna]